MKASSGPIQATSIDPYLTTADTIVLKNLLQDIDGPRKDEEHDDQRSIELLADLNNETGEAFEQTIVATWDLKDIHIPEVLQITLLQPYIRWAQRVVRRKTDVIFLTHILLYLATSVPSAIYLFCRFSWFHAIAHWVMTAYYCGAFTLMLHNHIHNNGVLAKRYAWFDRFWPYVLSPLMGHTWDSYYYHHVKHHHVENNGPDDLSSTIRYQRDDLFDFLIYVGRFMFFIWLELPLYFSRKRKPGLAWRSFLSESVSFLAIYVLSRFHLRAAIFTLLLPLLQMRIGMMVGNWGQHALVDEIEPDSDFRSSITLIDVPVSRPQPPNRYPSRRAGKANHSSE